MREVQSRVAARWARSQASRAGLLKQALGVLPRHSVIMTVGFLRLEAAGFLFPTDGNDQ